MLCLNCQVDFLPSLPTQKEKDDYKIKLGQNVYSGHHNGLTVWLDVETWDYGYTPATGQTEERKPGDSSQRPLEGFLFTDPSYHSPYEVRLTLSLQELEST